MQDWYQTNPAQRADRETNAWAPSHAAGTLDSVVETIAWVRRARLTRPPMRGRLSMQDWLHHDEAKLWRVYRLGTHRRVHRSVAPLCTTRCELGGQHGP